MAKHIMSLAVNGDRYEFAVDDTDTLLDVIRNQVGLTGTKRGCTTGSCGVCTINNDRGESILACLTHALEWDGEERRHVAGSRSMTGEKPHRHHIKPRADEVVCLI